MYKRQVSVSGMFIVAILIVVSLVIIANTIKVTGFNRRKEINIMKYVGATAGGSGSIYPSGIPSFPAKGTTLRETVR